MGVLDFSCLSFSSSASGNREDGKIKVLATCVEVLKGLQSFPGDLDFSCLSFSSSASGNREDGKVQVLGACVEVLKGLQSFPGDLDFFCLSLLLLLATGRTEKSRSWARVWKSLKGCRASPVTWTFFVFVFFCFWQQGGP